MKVNNYKTDIIGRVCVCLFVWLSVVFEKS